MLNPGDRIGDWEIVLPLGQGGMGSVYRCRHALSSRIEAAVKVLKPTDVPGARERFIREAEALHNLSHPAIVSTSGFGLDPNTGLLWLAMDLVHGEDLEKLLHRGAFPSNRVAEVFGPVAAGLAYAHGLGIVHRDIKPANLMLRRNGKPVLLDFGIAVQEGHERLTQEGVVPGTVAYAAPEQVMGEGPGDPALADVYALGQVLFECLTGTFRYPRTPDMGEHRRSVEILRSKMKIAPMDPGEGFAPRIRELVRGATHPDPALRGPALHRWREILDAGPLQLTADDEHTALVAAPPGLRSGMPPMSADVSLPGPHGVADMAPILDADTDVHTESGGVPWLWMGLGVGAVLVLAAGLALTIIVGGAALWFVQSPTQHAQTQRTPLTEGLPPPVELPPATPPAPPEEPPPAPVQDPVVATDVRKPRTPSDTSPTLTAGDAQLVVSSVQRARVYVNGSLVRLTPMTRRLAPGVYDVEIVRGNGDRQRFTVHLEANEKARRIWDFEKKQWRSFEGGVDEANLPLRPSVTGVKKRVAALPSVGACLADHPVTGAVTTRFVVAPDGSVVAGGIVQADHRSSATEACIDRALRSLNFPASQIGAAVSVDLQP